MHELLTFIIAFILSLLPGFSYDARPPASRTLSSLAIDPPQRIASEPLVIVGEGGTSGELFQYAAETYVREKGGRQYTVHDGDEFVQAMQDFVHKEGAIRTFVYIGHGNEVGLYVNQLPHVNGALYANDPALDEPYRAASIYSLPQTMFAAGSESTFYGCNIAREYEGQDSFAEQFADHFRTTVHAPTGPTEFSFSREGKTFLKSPATRIPEPVYLVPTAERKGFITISPSKPASAGFSDVYTSMEAASAIDALRTRELALGEGGKFEPYRSISYRDAKAFCQTVNPWATCQIPGVSSDSELVRNTAFLKLILDAGGFTLQKTSVPYQAQIWFGTQHNLLTRDFTKRKWFTRAEAAMLTKNILEYREQSGVAGK